MRDAADRTRSRVPSSRKTWLLADFLTAPMPAIAERSAENRIAQAVFAAFALIRHAAHSPEEGEWDSSVIHAPQPLR